MAYVRKTEDRPQFKAAWLNRRATALVASGLTPRMVAVLQLRDADGLTLKQIGEKFGMTAGWARQEYEHALRKLRHPARHHLLPKTSPAFPGQVLKRTK